jgi:hypothetical protein
MGEQNKELKKAKRVSFIAGYLWGFVSALILVLILYFTVRHYYLKYKPKTFPNTQPSFVSRTPNAPIGIQFQISVIRLS